VLNGDRAVDLSRKSADVYRLHLAPPGRLVAGELEVAANPGWNVAATAVADLVPAPATVSPAYARDVGLDRVLPTAARANVGGCPTAADGRDADNEAAAAGRIVAAADMGLDLAQDRGPLLLCGFPLSFGGCDNAEIEGEEQKG
jgi:hypothetical protein